MSKLENLTQKTLCGTWNHCLRWALPTSESTRWRRRQLVRFRSLFGLRRCLGNESTGWRPTCHWVHQLSFSCTSQRNFAFPQPESKSVTHKAIELLSYQQTVTFARGKWTNWAAGYWICKVLSANRQQTWTLASSVSNWIKSATSRSTTFSWPPSANAAPRMKSA